MNAITSRQNHRRTITTAIQVVLPAGSLAHATLFALIASLLVPYGPVRAYLWASLGAPGVNALALMLARPLAARSRAAALPG